MGRVDWGSTLQLAIYRMLVAGVLWAVLLPIFVGTTGWHIGVLLYGPICMAILVGVGLVSIALDKMGVPFAGLGALAAFPVVIGDPILWFVQRQRPGTLPVDRFGMLNRPILVINSN